MNDFCTPRENECIWKNHHRDQRHCAAQFYHSKCEAFLGYKRNHIQSTGHKVFKCIQNGTFPRIIIFFMIVGRCRLIDINLQTIDKKKNKREVGEVLNKKTDFYHLYRNSLNSYILPLIFFIIHHVILFVCIFMLLVRE